MIDRSKLQIPALPRGVIERRRLNGLLTFACVRPVVVLEAPAGFGKTTALLSWIGHSRGPVAWLTLDQFDNDPRRLARHIFEALDAAVPGLGTDALAAAREGADLVNVCLPLLTQSARRHTLGELVLVLDDFHVLTEDDCHEIIRGCVRAIMAQAHTVVTSRSRPQLRLRRGDISTITAEELTFRADESKQLLNGTYRLGLSEWELRELDFTAQGWPVGISLLGATRVAQRQSSAAPLEGQLDSIGRGALADYVVQELLDYLDEPLRAFLLKTAILQRLRGDLCEAVLQDPQAPELLEQLRAGSRMILTFGPDDGWVRIHELVRAVMMQRLMGEDPQLARELHRRAALWYSEQDLVPEAIDHAISTGDGLFAAQTLAGNAVELIDSRQYATLRRALATAPPEHGELAPVLAALDIRLAIRSGSVAYEVARERASHLAAEYPDRLDVIQMTDNVLTNPFLGDVGGAIATGRRALARDRHDSGLGPQRAVMLAQALWFGGEFDAMTALVEPYVDVTEPHYLGIWSRGFLASARAAAGNRVEAERLMREALELAGAAGIELAVEFPALPGAFAEILRAAGKLSEARAQIDPYLAGRELRWPRGMGHGLALTVDARIALAERRRKQARASATKARTVVAHFPDPGALISGWLDELTITLAKPSSRTLTGTQPTAAELRVLALLAQGCTRGEIADRLYLSDSTVKSHLRRLYRRLDVSSSAHAVAVAHERGFA